MGVFVRRVEVCWRYINHWHLKCLVEFVNEVEMSRVLEFNWVLWRHLVNMETRYVDTVV